jgi:hypothetical protein
MSDTEFWEQWCGSTARPDERIKRNAKVRKIDGRRWITYTDEINDTKVIVDMPEDAPPNPATKVATTPARTASAAHKKAA